MKQSLIIAGSGKMAVSIGDFFLTKGCSVTWVTESEEQHGKILRKITKAKRRLQKFFPEDLSSYQADCCLLGKDEIPHADLVIESTSESLEKKKRLFSVLVKKMSTKTIFCSNSSSFLPQTIMACCVGTHFFYPVSLTPCVELIPAQEGNGATTDWLLRFFREADCAIILESEKSPFLANRLMLSLQSECFRALLEGYCPKEVDAASHTMFLPIGQLSMMDNIGLDVLHSAVQQYTKYATFGTVDFDLMLSCLRELISLRKLGKKNRNGLLIGGGLPWPEKKQDAEHLKILAQSLQETMQRSCVYACESGEISLEQLRLICEEVFHCGDFDGILLDQSL